VETDAAAIAALAHILHISEAQTIQMGRLGENVAGAEVDAQSAALAEIALEMELRFGLANGLTHRFLSRRI
jgi:hypothetical protein